MAKRLFDRHLRGKANAGVRKLIRQAAQSAGTDPVVVERMVLAIGRNVSMSDGDRDCLAAAASDYRDMAHEKEMSDFALGDTLPSGDARLLIVSISQGGRVYQFVPHGSPVSNDIWDVWKLGDRGFAFDRSIMAERGAHSGKLWKTYRKCVRNNDAE